MSSMHEWHIAISAVGILKTSLKKIKKRIFIAAQYEKGFIVLLCTTVCSVYFTVFEKITVMRTWKLFIIYYLLNLCLGS